MSNGMNVDNQLNKIMTDPKKKMKWNTEHERLLSEWGNQAKCYAWLHNYTYKLYKHYNRCFTIPIIFLSTISSVASYGIQQMFPSFDYGNIVIGTFSIIVTLLSAINNTLRYAELSESHRVTEIHYTKFYTSISTQLSLIRSDRAKIDNFLLICKAELDRLIEQSPAIPGKIKIRFKNKFRKKIQFALPTQLDTIMPIYISGRKDTIINIDNNDYQIQQNQDYNQQDQDQDQNQA